MVTVLAVEYDREEDWLARRGGWVLLVMGAVLVGLSVLIAEKQAVASILAFSGVAAAIFGVLLSRLEGAFEFSPTKFAATLKAARRVSVREDLTLEEKADVLLQILDVTPVPTEGRRADTAQTSEQPHRDQEVKASGPLPRPLPFTVTGPTDQIHHVGQAFLGHVARVFGDNGWTVDVLHGPGGGGFDIVAERDGAKRYIEVKYRHRLSTADAREFIGAVSTRDDPPGTSYTLAVPVGTLSAAARETLSAVPTIDVWEVPVER